VGEAAALSAEADRVKQAIEDYPCADRAANCSGSDHESHAELMAAQTMKVLQNAADWVRRLEAAGGQGLALRGQRDGAPNLEEARAHFQDALGELGDEAQRTKRREERIAERNEQVMRFIPDRDPPANVRRMAREAGRKVISLEGEAELAGLLGAAAARIVETASSVAERHAIEGILYRRPSGEEWLAIGARYSTFGLGAQAATGAFGLLSAILVALSAGGIVRRRKALGALAARLPRSLY
jgi:hypothetical protein